MPARITGQAEAYGLGHPPTAELPDPAQFADLLGGPRIMGGLLRTSVDTRDMDPDSHAYHEDTYTNTPGGRIYGDEDGTVYVSPRRHWNEGGFFEPTERDELASELMAEDDDSGYNWGPDPTGKIPASWTTR